DWPALLHERAGAEVRAGLTYQELRASARGPALFGGRGLFVEQLGAHAFGSFGAIGHFGPRCLRAEAALAHVGKNRRLCLGPRHSGAVETELAVGSAVEQGGRLFAAVGALGAVTGGRWGSVVGGAQIDGAHLAAAVLLEL